MEDIERAARASRKRAVAIDHGRVEDVLALFKLQSPQVGQYRNRTCLWWDVSDLTSWPQVTSPLRVVRSVETSAVRCQATGELRQENTEWLWVTNLPASVISTATVLRLGHARWDIENYGFNELVNGWHSDHGYKHDPTAIEAFYLTVFLAFNLFHALLLLNIKPTLRQGKTDCYWARAMAAEVCSEIPGFNRSRALRASVCGSLRQPENAPPGQ